MLVEANGLRPRSLEKVGWFAAPKYENQYINDASFASIASPRSLAAYPWLVSNKVVARQHRSSDRKCMHVGRGRKFKF